MIYQLTCYSVLIRFARPQKQGNPMRLQDLAIITQTPLDSNRVLFERFRLHDRIVHDPKTDLYSYKVISSNATFGMCLLSYSS